MGPEFCGYGKVLVAIWGSRRSDQYRKTNREYQKRRRDEQPDVRDYHRRWNKEHAVQIRANALVKRQQTRELIRLAKSHPCLDCGVFYPSYVMDFDHVRGKKVANISSGRFMTAPKRLLAEINKCDVVCANCHREREHKRREEKKVV